MGNEPSQQRGPSARALSGSTVGSGQSATSPLRALLVIVPLLVMVAAATNLMGLWTTPYQQAAREEQPAQTTNRSVAKEVPFPFGAAGKAPEASESQFDASVVLALLKTANPAEGASLFRMCMPCHAGEKNGPHGLGSNLWGIVGSRKAAHPDFRYSAALKAKGGTWSYRELAEYLHDPRTFAPGTSMFFVGMTDNRKVANLLAYLRTLSDNPAPLPK